MKNRHDYMYSYNQRNIYKKLLYRLVVTIIVFLLFYLMANNVYARTGSSVEIPDLSSITRASTWLLPSDGVYIEALELESKVDIKVSGMIARASVKQQFRNTSSLWAEGIYVFPLPENAAVDHFRLIIDGRVIEGEIQEKTQARKTYQQAKQNGKRAGLIEQQRPNIFTTKLANIAPGAALSVEIEYQQTLVYRDGEYALRYPLVVGERYITPSRQGATDSAYDTGVYTESSTTSTALNLTSINVHLEAGISLANIVSSSHEIMVRPQADNHYDITLQEATVPADRDFLLSWTPELGKLPKAAVLNQKHEGYDYSLITVYPPQNEFYNAFDIPREVIFILDVSGSMSGASIEQAKSALQLALDRLKPSDKFNIIWFNTAAKKMYFNARFASNGNVQQARQFVNSLQANGGTEMLPALKLALTSAAEPELLRQIVFITDGNVSNERDLFAYINANLNGSRLFTVGIGSAPSSFFMKKAAQAGRGSFTFISDTREVGKTTETLFRKLETPALTDIALTIFGDDIETYHEPIPDLYIGEPVTVLVRAKNRLNTVTLTGNIGATPWRHKLSLTQGSDNEGVRLAWAREKISLLSRSHYDENDSNLKYHLKLQIIGESIKHHLISQFTSLVAVEQTPVNQSGELYSETVKNNLPYGWTRSQENGRTISAQQIYLPQTATPSYQHLILAIVFALLALVIQRMRFRL